MIPSDVTARLQLTADAAVARAPSVQQVSDALADLVPGQRVLAAIQARLPTGVYRALINQRDVTLALPFSAKAGDTLELEVVENEGRLMLAFVTRRDAGAASANAGAQGQQAAETSLSGAGRLIAGLLPKSAEGQSAKPAQLNANQPIANAPPLRGGELVPLLRQAIMQSGMFYESHQARWVSNELPVETLLTQPQGRLSSAHALAQAADPGVPMAGTLKVVVPSTEAPVNAGESSRQTLSSGHAAIQAQAVAPETVPLVQQQLEALATHTYVWQGQAWPGQTLRWEIEEDPHHQSPDEAEGEAPWQTRLTLSLPLLGEVNAMIRLSGNTLSLGLVSESDNAAARLSGGGDALREQLAAAGLELSSFVVSRHERPENTE